MTKCHVGLLADANLTEIGSHFKPEFVCLFKPVDQSIRGARAMCTVDVPGRAPDGMVVVAVTEAGLGPDQLRACPGRMGSLPNQKGARGPLSMPVLRGAQSSKASSFLGTATPFMVTYTGMPFSS